MKRNMKFWVSDIINSKKRAVLPVMTYPGLKLVNKSVMDVITDGEFQYECIKALSEIFPTSASVTIMDLSVEAEAFGSPIRFSDNEVPTVTSPIITDVDDANKFKVPTIGAGRTNIYINAARLCAENIVDRPTFGGIIGPFSLAGRLLDMTEIMVQALMEPDMVHTILEKCTAFLTEYASAFKNAGANGVIIAEPAAGLLSPEMCAEFSSAYVKRIIDAVQDDNFMVILHNCGNTVKLVPSLLSTGAMGLHFGNAVDMLDILPQVPENILVMGNIDPARVFKNGSVEDMRVITANLLNRTRSYKNFILSSGCDIPPGTPIENVNAFFAALDAYNFFSTR